MCDLHLLSMNSKLWNDGILSPHMYYYNVISGCKAIPGVTGFGAKRPKPFPGLPAIWKCFQELQFVKVFSSSVGVCCLLPIMGDANDGNRAETKSTALKSGGLRMLHTENE